MLLRRLKKMTPLKICLQFTFLKHETIDVDIRDEMNHKRLNSSGWSEASGHSFTSTLFADDNSSYIQFTF